MPSVAGFLPSTHGLPFTNAWPSQAIVAVDVPPFGQVDIGDARNGLCGGMVFNVRDFFEAGQVPPDAPQPTQGQPYFGYIVRRLIDSFDIPRGVLRYLEWMNTPDHDTGIGPFVRRGVAWRTIVDELPKISGDIDAGHPSPLGLVAAQSLNPVDLGKNHVVLAYGYNLVGSTMTLRVYDPNRGRNDNVTMSLDVSNPTHTTPINHTVHLGDPIRGFFRLDYSPVDPSVVQNRQNDWRWCRKCGGLFWAGGQSAAGACPAEGAHEKGGSGEYTLTHNMPSAPGQHDWRYCRRCGGLFWANGQAASGTCPAGGQHVRDSSGDYALVADSSGGSGQNDWRRCHKCAGLFWAGAQDSVGVCPARGQHERGTSSDYALEHLG